MLFFLVSSYIPYILALVCTHLSHHRSLTNGKIFTDRQQAINMFIFCCCCNMQHGIEWKKMHSSVQNVIWHFRCETFMDNNALTRSFLVYDVKHENNLIVIENDLHLTFFFQYPSKSRDKRSFVSTIDFPLKALLMERNSSNFQTF